MATGHSRHPLDVLHRRASRRDRDGLLDYALHELEGSDAGLYLAQVRHSIADPIANSLTRVMAAAVKCLAGSDDLTLLQDTWLRVAGPDIAPLCRPDSIRDGTLHVSCLPAAMFELQPSLRGIQAAVAAATSGRIRQVRLTPAGRRA